MIDYIIKDKGFLQYLEKNKILSDEDMKQMIEVVSEIQKNKKIDSADAQ